MIPKRRLTIYRGKSRIQLKLANGDVYTDRAELTDIIDNSLHWETEYCNSDSTVGYKGGKLANGTYYGIMGYRWKDGGWKGKRVIKLFHTSRDITKVTHESLTDDEMTLPSEIPNPNHGGERIIQYCQVHQGGAPTDANPWDWSHGCITVMSTFWECIAGMIDDNEIIQVVVK